MFKSEKKNYNYTLLIIIEYFFSLLTYKEKSLVYLFLIVFFFGIIINNTNKSEKQNSKQNLVSVTLVAVKTCGSFLYYFYDTMIDCHYYNTIFLQ